MEDIVTSPYFWVGISFVVFVALIYSKGKLAINAALDAKIEEISKRIEHAENLRIEAQELLAQYQRKQRDTLKDAEQIMENAKERSAAIKKQAELEIEELLRRRENQMNQRIEQLRIAAVEDIQKTASDIAIDAAKEVIIENITKKATTELVEASIADAPALVSSKR